MYVTLGWGVFQWARLLAMGAHSVHVPGVCTQVWVCLPLSAGMTTGVTRPVPLWDPTGLPPGPSKGCSGCHLLSFSLVISLTFHSCGTFGACGDSQAELPAPCPLHAFQLGLVPSPSM